MRKTVCVQFNLKSDPSKDARYVVWRGGAAISSSLTYRQAIDFVIAAKAKGANILSIRVVTP